MRRFNSSLQKNKGFTIIEIVVVVTIIIIILAITLVSYRQGNQRLTLKRANHKLAQDIRRAQEMAMSTKEFQGSIPLGGYGLTFNSSNTTYTISTFQSNNQSSSTVEQITLEKGVKIDKLYSISGQNQTEVSSLYFNFIPPEPVTCVLACVADGAKIVLSLQQATSVTRSVRINKTGLIEIIE